MRRSDREIVSQSDILAVLNECDIIHIGLCADNKPYVIPMNFAWEVKDGEILIYLHCASKGKKLDIIEKNNNVCFEADCSYRTIKGKTACEWSAEYQSIIGEGIISALPDETQKVAALDLLMKRYGFEGRPEYSRQAIEAVTVLQISVQSITGKRNIKKS